MQKIFNMFRQWKVKQIEFKNVAGQIGDKCYRTSGQNAGYKFHCLKYFGEEESPSAYCYHLLFKD